MRSTVMAVLFCAMLLPSGCAATDGGRRGLSGPVKYRNMSCARLDRERAKVEAATGRLFLALRRKGVFGQRDEAETLALWPTLLFLKGPSSRDQAAYRRLDRDYALLRRTAREQGCADSYAQSVSETVRGGGRSPPAARINAVVDQETRR